MAWVTNELPRSFWHSRRRRPREVEAVVVGGGIVGLSTAWWLSRMAPPGYRVVLLEEGHLAGRASGRNAGFLLTGTPEPFTRLADRLGKDAALALWHRTRENRELVRAELLDPGVVDADFLPEGSWHASLAGTPQPPLRPEEPAPHLPTSAEEPAQPASRSAGSGTPPSPTRPEEPPSQPPTSTEEPAQPASRSAGSPHPPTSAEEPGVSPASRSAGSEASSSPNHHPSPQEDALAASCQALRDEGFDCEWRDAAAVREASGSPGLGGAIFQARDGGLDPVLLCRGLAETGGFEIHTGVRVLALEPASADGGEAGAGAGGDRVRVVTEARDWVAEHAVVALNAYAGVVLPFLARRLQPVRGQMLSTVPGERPLRGVWYVNDGQEYLRQTTDGTVVLGGRRLVAEGSEVGFLEAPTARLQGALEDFLAQLFPHLGGRPIQHRWAGIMAFTDTGLPLFGEVPDVPNARYAAGFNGHGMSLGFVTGRWLARKALAGQEGVEAPGELLPAPGRGEG